jgi:hypothetical protein
VQNLAAFYLGGDDIANNVECTAYWQSPLSRSFSVDSAFSPRAILFKLTRRTDHDRSADKAKALELYSHFHPNVMFLTK